MEHSSCGVGFLVSLKNNFSNENLQRALTGLKNVEHRGGIGKDHVLSDGAGILTDIPFELFGYEKGKVAIASIFGPQDKEEFKKSLEIFEKTFEFNSLKVLEYREIPIDESILSPVARENLPKMIQAVIKRPAHCRTMASFDKLLHLTKQMVRTKQKEGGILGQFFFSSLSCHTIVYKALTTGADLEKFYLDLQNKNYKTRLALFHRRFSTNTVSSWDKIQPFRLIGHNGEINTIEGNKSAAISREKQIGLRQDELITHHGTSDSGNLNGMVEALKYRSSIPNITEILSILIPPAGKNTSAYFKFWSRAMEPWDGPALIAYCDGKRIGARLDRNGFRPARWCKTEDTFYLASEAGCFELDTKNVLSQGTIYAGRNVSIHIPKGEISFANPDKTEAYRDAHFDARLFDFPYQSTKAHIDLKEKTSLFYYTEEEFKKELYPMIISGKEAIGSMGDTARNPALSPIHRSIYDYFFQGFAQVTNPPLDYIREKLVTELQVFLGRKPNIFEPKELIPPPIALRLSSPIISLGQMEAIKNIENTRPELALKSSEFSITFQRSGGEKSFEESIEKIVKDVVTSVINGSSIVILSDRKANFENPPIPSIFVLHAIQLELNRLGIRLRNSIVIDTAEIKNAHQVSVLIGFGASAICPYYALEFARTGEISDAQHLFPDEREKNLINALEQGLLRTIAKRGISVIRSYQGAELFSIIGFSEELLKKYFPRHKTIIGGLTTKSLVDEILKRSSEAFTQEKVNNFVYKEHSAEKMGEKHSMTSRRARLLHQSLTQLNDSKDETGLNEFFTDFSEPINIRHILDYKKVSTPLEKVCEASEITKTFGCGAMSFGAISAESQRDLIKAFKIVGGRSNSGEGGENPFYYEDGTTASVKQIASGRFGVTAEYLVLGNEVQIKMAQGAKPGEGGQLMGVKVNADIARARFSNQGVDLISPPPQHDIYSIEDLRELIYELKELHPTAKVSVKLVSSRNIGAIALGVVKAGADIIQISGGDGGTGAASLMSMKHAGLAWEIGLTQVHETLYKNNLRENVILRVDGGLQTGKDVIMATLMGAEEFDFGKIVLVSQGCIMARVCEKNTCPTGIATHDPKFKKRYTGKVDDVVNYLKYLAYDVQKHLKQIGEFSLKDLVGRRDLLIDNSTHSELIKRFNLNLDYFKSSNQHQYFKEHWHNESAGVLNNEIYLDYKNDSIKKLYPIKSTDRAIPAKLSGELAREMVITRKSLENRWDKIELSKKTTLNFTGSAGQGFAVFNNGLNIYLDGQANDSVAKGMSAGKVVIRLLNTIGKHSYERVLVGNAALYGATGGKFFCAGLASDRFAVRNSGAHAVVEGAGLHACEYMTGGVVMILGPALENIGAGMTGGVIYTVESNLKYINSEYIKESPVNNEDRKIMNELLNEYYLETNSKQEKLTAAELIKLIPL